MINLSVLYHINFNHLSLSFSQRTLYIEKYLPLILNSLVINSTVSICTEDLLLLKAWNPECFYQLINHPKIKFLLPFHTHTIPQCFPSKFLLEAKLGKQIINDLISKDKLTNIGYSSEADLFPKKILTEITKVWDGIILGETRIKIDNLSWEKYPPIFNITNQQHSIKAYLSRRKFEYRDCFHQYLREDTTIDTVISAIKENYSKFAEGKALLARIDLEALVLNAYTKNNKNDVSSITRWKLLQDSLIKEGINDCFLDDYFQGESNIPVLNLTKVHVGHEEDYKWSNSALQSTINKYNFSKMERKLKALLLSLYCSDYYCSRLPDLIFTHPKNKSRKITISKDRLCRNQEFNFKLKILKRELDYETLFLEITNKDLLKYFYYFSKTINETAKYL
ncbi:hypothetical protein HY386_02055 [Candidatus Daviesbacteria bacterium]|nr:hypothetical protein [Candidatus Daviesbacteria bacterium]